MRSFGSLGSYVICAIRVRFQRGVGASSRAARSAGCSVDRSMRSVLRSIGPRSAHSIGDWNGV